jgi:hypothetical protein
MKIKLLQQTKIEKTKIWKDSIMQNIQSIRIVML